MSAPTSRRCTRRVRGPAPRGSRSCARSCEPCATPPRPSSGLEEDTSGQTAQFKIAKDSEGREDGLAVLGLLRFVVPLAALAADARQEPVAPALAGDDRTGGGRDRRRDDGRDPRRSEEAAQPGREDRDQDAERTAERERLGRLEER